MPNERQPNQNDEIRDFSEEVASRDLVRDAVAGMFIDDEQELASMHQYGDAAEKQERVERIRSKSKGSFQRGKQQAQREASDRRYQVDSNFERRAGLHQKTGDGPDFEF